MDLSIYLAVLGKEPKMGYSVSKSVGAFAVCIALAGAGACAVVAITPQQAEAAAYKTACFGKGSPMVNDTTVKIGKTVYRCESSTIKASKMKKFGKYGYQEIGKPRILTKKAAEYNDFVTNGKYLYYVQQKVLEKTKESGYTHATKSRFTLCRITIKNKAEKKILTFTGYELRPHSAVGNYVYYTSQQTDDGGEDGGRCIYVYDIKAKTNKLIASEYSSDLDPNFVRAAGNRIIIGGDRSEDPNGKPLYSLSLTGTDKKKIADTEYWSWNVKGNKVRYTVGKNGMRRAYQCGNLGQNRKALTGWTTGLKAEKMLVN